jgi:hypothetical protein
MKNVILLKNHAKKRINERTNLSHNTIKAILYSESYIPLGYDLNKKNVKHLMFYSFKDNEFYIICQDENNLEVITILYGMEFKCWAISLDTYNECKLMSLLYIVKNHNNPRFNAEQIKFINTPGYRKKYPEINKFLKLNNVQNCTLEKDAIINEFNTNNEYLSLIDFDSEYYKCKYKNNVVLPKSDFVNIIEFLKIEPILLKKETLSYVFSEDELNSVVSIYSKYLYEIYYSDERFINVKKFLKVSGYVGINTTKFVNAIQESLKNTKVA